MDDFTVGFGASAQDGFGTSVFQEHREFFLTYRLPDEQDLKAALRWRYAFRTVDAETGKEYTPAEVQSLPENQRWLLTTKPLGGEQIQTVVEYCNCRTRSRDGRIEGVAMVDSRVCSNPRVRRSDSWSYFVSPTSSRQVITL